MESWPGEPATHPLSTSGWLIRLSKNQDKVSCKLKITLQIQDKNWFFLSHFYTKVENEFSFIYYESPSFV